MVTAYRAGGLFAAMIGYVLSVSTFIWPVLKGYCWGVRLYSYGRWENVGAICGQLCGMSGHVVVRWTQLSREPV
jgi:hypothetical protein